MRPNTMPEIAYSLQGRICVFVLLNAQKADNFHGIKR